MSVKSNKSQRKQPAPTLTETMSDHLPSPIGSTKLPSLTKAELTSPIQQQHPTSSSTSKKTQPLILINQHQDETAVANAASSLVASSISQVKLKLSPSTLPLPSTGSYNSMSLTNSLSSVISVSSSSCASINTNNLIKDSLTNIITNSISSPASMISSSPSPTNQLYPAGSLNPQTNLTSLSKASSANSASSSNSTCYTINNTSINNAAADGQAASQAIVNASAAETAQGSNYYNDHLVGNGHFFTKKTFHKLTYCHHCTEMLWGIISQGLVCEVCNFVCHEKCQKSVVSTCSSIAHTLIKNPVPHCWSEPFHFKRKFCNICRKRLDENLGVRCEICEYYVHCDCQVLAVNDCCETALYVPNRKNVSHKHHWREGNLPTNSKCIVCKKTCWTTECLAGMKCEWCGITVHSTCRIRLVDECNFGSLRDIIVAPYAVSVPRINMNKEAILGIQSNRPTMRSNSNDWLVDPKSESNSGHSLCSPSILNSNSQLPPHTSNQQYSSTTSNELNDNTSSNNSTSNASAATTKNPITNLLQTQQSQTTSTTTTMPTTSVPLPLQDNINNTKPTTTTSNAVATTTANSSSSHGGSSKKKSSKTQTAEEEEDEVIKVYDGNTSLRKSVFRTIFVNKNCSYLGILEASLRTFHINDDPQNYYVSIPISKSNALNQSGSWEDLVEETIVDESNPIKSIKALAAPKPAILLRYKDNESENIRIYPGVIKETSCYQTILINSQTSVLRTVEMALEKFQIKKQVNQFSLIEVLLDQDVNERLLNANDYPLQLIKKLRKESLCNNRMVRFYLQQKEDPHGTLVSLFVGNLPASLSQIQYEKILMDTLKNQFEIRWSRFDVIYYEYGSMVIQYEDAHKAIKAYKMLKDSVYENKQLMVLLLPTIQHQQMMLPNVVPLLVFVNVKSGGQQGAELITSFRHLLNPHQVFDLQNGGPLPGLYVFRNIERYRILACGGDGTIGWVLSCLDNVSQDAKCQSPPMAIVPLGTGNDLSRVLRWGAGYTGAEEPINLLRDVIEADEIMLDRWTVVFHSDENKELDDIKRQLSIAVNVSQANTNEDNTEIYVMNNYFGIGIDAEISLDFHNAREENPDKFRSRIQNKKKYFQLGIRRMMNNMNKDFHKNVTLEVDGRRIEISPQIEGIVILNILSWASGTRPWGLERDDQFQKPTHNDGMLEVVGIKGVVHLGQIQGGLSSAIRLAQGGRIKIRMNTEVPVQIDGEPWLQSPCAITLLKSALKATMLKKSKLKIKRRNTEPNINVLVTNLTNAKESNSTLDPDAESEPF